MKIDLYKGYIIRWLFTIGFDFVLLPVIGLILVLLSKITIGIILFIIYLTILVLTLIVLLIRCKNKYHYLYLNDEYFSLINNKGEYIDFENQKIYIDNPVYGFLVSPINLLFSEDIKEDFIIKGGKIIFTEVYLTIGCYLKIKKMNYRYILTGLDVKD